MVLPPTAQPPPGSPDKTEVHRCARGEIHKAAPHLNREGLYNTCMTAITAPMPAHIPQLRPLNIVRDLPGVADLVEKCFADTMDEDGRNYIQQMRRAGKDNVFLRWASSAVETASMPLSGYIWEENGEIIGNASLIPYRHERKKYYLIANVAVRPEYRNRGIGRALTLAVMHHAKQRHANETWLHVRADNPGAIGLYTSLGFVELARRTAWQAQPGRDLSAGSPVIAVTRRLNRDWPAQETWLRRIYPDLLTWYQPMPWNSLRPGLGPALYRFLSDYEVRHWATRKYSLPSAVLSWQAMAGRHNRIWAAVPPEGQEDNLTALLRHARQVLSGREKISLDFPAGQYTAAIEAAGFHPHRTLLWMKSDETSPDEQRKSI
jgi:ribosomal protein S18 acetylase RimI-like enzyme